ncbi:MAG TPA: serpin family protein [Anaerolineales bacterium]|nr:serpin family protein [Anaerolineales bacterium]
MKTPLFPKLATILVVLVLLLSACGPSASIAKSDLPRISVPNVPVDEIHALTDNNNAFALDLYQSLRSRDGNLIYSPYSISLALAMTYAGARGETESQMAQTLHFLPQNKLHSALNELDLELAKRGEAQSKDAAPLQLDIANAVWAEQTFPFLKDYLDLIARNYGAGIQLADFINGHETIRKQINSWVSNETHDKIQDLIPDGVLDPSTKMVLVNAIYFKADWMVQFDPNDTHDAPFHLLDGSDVQVKMMSKSLFGLSYIQGNGYQAVELPYQGETAAMDIILPDEGKFSEVESGLDAQKLNEILGGMQPGGGLELGLPKFHFSTDFDLKDRLTSMGMPAAFDPNLADFSGMTGGKDLYIDTVLHKALVAVDEKGTEAAAATAVIMAPTSARLPDVNLTIDRPFIFVIRDLPSGQILFVGRVLNPVE